MITLCDDIHVLLFSGMELTFGMDMDAIAEIHRPEQVSGRYSRIVRFDEKLSFGKREISCHRPMVIGVKGTSFGIIINQPTDINVAIPIDSIHPMPHLIQLSCRQKALWGVVILYEKLCFLVDPYKLT